MRRPRSELCVEILIDVSVWVVERALQHASEGHED